MIRHAPAERTGRVRIANPFDGLACDGLAVTRARLEISPASPVDLTSRFAGHTRTGILNEVGVEDRVGDESLDLVGVALVTDSEVNVIEFIHDPPSYRSLATGSPGTASAIDRSQT